MTADSQAADQEAVEAIAEEIQRDHIECCFTTEHIYDQAEHIVEALAEAGYTVVKTEDVRWEYGNRDGNGEVWKSGSKRTALRTAARWAEDPDPLPAVQRMVGPWVPVPEGSAEEAGGE